MKKNLRGIDGAVNPKTLVQLLILETGFRSTRVKKTMCEPTPASNAHFRSAAPGRANLR
jgi:hypothetical protein